MVVLYPADPLNAKRVDEAFGEEANAAKAAGIDGASFSR